MKEGARRREFEEVVVWKFSCHSLMKTSAT
jgi:hypothetical protein